jgi:hypothetical protein
MDWRGGSGSGRGLAVVEGIGWMGTALRGRPCDGRERCGWAARERLGIAGCVQEVYGPVRLGSRGRARKSWRGSVSASPDQSGPGWARPGSLGSAWFGPEEPGHAWGPRRGSHGAARGGQSRWRPGRSCLGAARRGSLGDAVFRLSAESMARQGRARQSWQSRFRCVQDRLGVARQRSPGKARPVKEGLGPVWHPRAAREGNGLDR